MTSDGRTWLNAYDSLDTELAERLDDLRAARLRHAAGSDVVPIDAARR
jgi:hypothetical protein